MWRRSSVSGLRSRSMTPRVTLRASFCAFSSAGFSRPTCSSYKGRNADHQVPRQQNNTHLTTHQGPCKAVYFNTLALCKCQTTGGAPPDATHAPMCDAGWT